MTIAELNARRLRTLDELVSERMFLARAMDRKPYTAKELSDVWEGVFSDPFTVEEIQAAINRRKK